MHRIEALVGFGIELRARPGFWVAHMIILGAIALDRIVEILIGIDSNRRDFIVIQTGLKLAEEVLLDESGDVSQDCRFGRFGIHLGGVDAQR